MDYMKRAIELALQGGGWTNPNPMVGAVIVKDGRIIGEGYHRRCGELHAERNAFASLTESAEGAEIYVTLEPCCHYGRTPPCTEAIIENGIRRVYIGSRDPNPLVSGKGAAILREHGIEVIEDVLRDECDAINPIFFHFITHRRPYVLMKYAMTLDGKIATHTGASKWITGSEARGHVQKLRGKYAAILVGITTVLKDDPMLNCRIEGAHQPLRIILDSDLRTPPESAIALSAGEFPTMIVYARHSERESALAERGVELVYCPNDKGKVDLRKLMDILAQRNVDSVLVEGGGEVHESFRAAGLVNHVCCYIAPKLFGGRDAPGPIRGLGVTEPSEATLLTNCRLSFLGDDILLEFDIREG